MNPNQQLEPVYDSAVTGIQSQIPAIQNLYQSLVQGLQNQQQAQVQNVVNSAVQRGVGSDGITQGANDALGAALTQSIAPLALQNTQNIAGLQGQIGQTKVNRANDVQQLSGLIQQQNLAKQRNQLQLNQIQQNYDLNRIQAQQAQAKAASDAAAKMDIQTFVNNIEAALIKSMGGDKHVSPEDFKAGLQLWTQKGLPASEYLNQFKSFIDTSHIQDYVR